VRRAAVAGATLAFAVAGCGDGGRPSHDAYVTHAEAVCTAYDSRVKLLTQPGSFDATIAYVERTLPLYVAALDRLAALKPAQQDTAAVHTWLAADRRVVASLRTLRAAAMRHDLAATNQAATALQDASHSARQAAGALGLTACATP